MSATHQAVLVWLVDRYETTGAPQSPEAIAKACDAPPEEIGKTLETLAEFELVATVDDAYRPTITAHELVRLDVFDDGGFIIDVREE